MALKINMSPSQDLWHLEYRDNHYTAWPRQRNLSDISPLSLFQLFTYKAWVWMARQMSLHTHTHAEDDNSYYHDWMISKQTTVYWYIHYSAINAISGSITNYWWLVGLVIRSWTLFIYKVGLWINLLGVVPVCSPVVNFDVEISTKSENVEKHKNISTLVEKALKFLRSMSVFQCVFFYSASKERWQNRRQNTAVDRTFGCARLERV